MQRRFTMKAARLLAFLVCGQALGFGQEPEPGGDPAGQPAAAATKPDAAALAKKMDRLLEAWEKKSTELKSLDVSILRIDQNPAWGEIEYFEGRALFKSPDLAFIDWNKIQQDAKKKPVRDPQNKTRWLSAPFERIICTGDEVWQYKSDTQQIFIFPLGKDRKQRAIDEGPLPFLFNMRADDARRRYEMRLVLEDEKSYGVSIKPKLKEDMESFSIAHVKLDRRYLLPVRIIMLSPDGKSQKEFRLNPIYPNKAVNSRNFEGKPLGAPWKTIRNPGGADRPAGAKTRQRDAGGEPAAARGGADAIER